MKVGIVGLGKMGMLHTGILNTLDDVRIVSVAESESQLMKYIKNAIPSANVYEDYQKMIKSEELDLVYITTPPSSHMQIALECVNRGVNFFVEKPLTSNLEEAMKLCAELKNTQVVHSVGYNMRFLETFLKAKYFLSQKILGEVSSVKSSMYVSNIFSKPSGWRFKKKTSGGGVLLELGCHLIDFLLWYCGPIKKVSGQVKSLYSAVEDTAHMEVEFSNNAHGVLDTSWSIEGYRTPEANIEIVGSNGKLRVNQDFIKIELASPVPPLKETSVIIYKQSLENGVPFDVAGPDYTKEDMHVVQCVKEKKQPLVNVVEASKTQSVIQAMYDAAKSESIRQVEYIE